MRTTGVVGPSEHGSILVTDQDSDQDMNAKILAFCTIGKSKKEICGYKNNHRFRVDGHFHVGPAGINLNN